MYSECEKRISIHHEDIEKKKVTKSNTSIFFVR